MKQVALGLVVEVGVRLGLGLLVDEAVTTANETAWFIGGVRSV